MAKKGETKASASKRSKAQRKYNGTAEQKKNRAMRNTARRQAIKSGAASKGDGKDVGHKKTIKSGGTNAKSNRKIQDRKSNRSEGGKIGDKKKKAAGGRKGGKK
jgi:hypothetical protein